MIKIRGCSCIPVSDGGCLFRNCRDVDGGFVDSMKVFTSFLKIFMG